MSSDKYRRAIADAAGAHRARKASELQQAQRAAGDQKRRLLTALNDTPVEPWTDPGVACDRCSGTVHVAVQIGGLPDGWICLNCAPKYTPQ